MVAVLRPQAAVKRKARETVTMSVKRVDLAAVPRMNSRRVRIDYPIFRQGLAARAGANS
jgi:hypothetical protein